MKKNKVFKRFKEVISTNCAKYDINEVSVVGPLVFSFIEEYTQSVIYDKEYFKKTIKYFLNKDFKKIAVFPCNRYIKYIIDLFDDKEFYICDDNKQGSYVNKHKIYSPEIIEKEDFDLVLIISYTKQIKDNLINRLNKTQKILWINDITQEYLKYDKDIYNKINKEEVDFNKVDDILALIRKSNKPLVFLNGFLFNNYEPTFKSLEKNGYTPIVIAMSDILY